MVEAERLSCQCHTVMRGALELDLILGLLPQLPHATCSAEHRAREE
jgi:hypothetical protein